MSSRINNPKRMRQLVDFRGLDIDGYIYPTDIDGIIEYKNSEYIIFEIKHGSAAVPAGQKLTLQRLVDDFNAVGKKAVVFICEHTVRDCNKPVVAAWCKVREIYDGDRRIWVKPLKDISVRQAVDIFQENPGILMSENEVKC